MQSKQRIARRVRALAENRLVLAVEDWRGSAILRKAGKSQVPAHRSDAHILLAPPGAGNIGDQAMVEAFVASVSGPVLIITRRAGDVREMPQELAERATVVVMPGLLYGLPWQHLRDLQRLAPPLRGALSFSVVGADIMDGAYWESPSVRRFRLARFAAELGVDSRVLGFSWNDAPSPAARREMVRASRALDLLARDPKSVSRLIADGGERVVPVADIALLTEPRPITEIGVEGWCAEQRSEGRRIVLLNANGLIEASSGLVDTYEALINSPVGSSCAFVALPHVSRGVPSDIDLVDALMEKVGDRAEVFPIRRLLSPGEVASLASLADLAVTGRMHLSILSASVGTPTVTVGYQGKVAGFYELLGTSSFINGGAEARRGLLSLIEESLRNLDELTSTVELAREGLRDKARRNVAGLDRAR